MVCEKKIDVTGSTSEASPNSCNPVKGAKEIYFVAI